MTPFTLKQRCLALIVAAAATLVATHGALAQQATPKSDAPHAEAAAAPTQEDLQTLLLTLRDPAQRDALAAQIETLLTLQQQQPAIPEEDRGIGARVLGALSAGFNSFSDALNDVGRSFGDSSRLLLWLEIQGTDPGRRAMWLGIGKDLALSLGGGLLAAFVVGLGVKRARHRLAHRAGDRWFRRMRFSAARLTLELLPVIAFGVIAFGVIGWMAPPEVTRLALLAIVNATLISLAGAVIARFVFSPIEPGLRLVPLSDSSAVYLYIWARRLIVVAVWGYVLLETALLLGMPASGYLVGAKLLGFVLTALLIILVLQNRSTVATWIRGEAPVEGRRIVPGAVRQRAAEIWHVAATAYLLGIYLVWALDVEGGFLYLVRATVATLLVIAAVAAGEHWLPRLFNRFSGIDAALLARYPLVAARANRYVPVLRRLLVYAVRIVACLLILAAWQVDVGGVLFSESGRDALGRVTDIVIVLVLALVVWEVASGLISAHLSRQDETGYAMLRSARARTLLPLIRNVLLIVISVMATLVVLSEIGIDIAPLLAGAGVVGLAVGFGAQSLVKDVITGAFLLFEDTINIGDVVDVGGGKSGLVEGMTIRSIRLRDYNGNLHTVNFGAVGAITNMTRDFSYYLLDVKVPYRYEVGEVVEALQAVDKELRADPSLKGDITAPIEIAGVEALADTTFIIRARIRTRPIRQWDVGRAFLARMKQKFEEKGIQLAVPALPANVVVSEGGQKAHVAAAIATRRRRPDEQPPDKESAAG